MPHVIIEMSANLADALPAGRVVDTIHAAVLDTGFAPLDSVRTRMHVHENYRVAGGDPAHGFLAIVARIGPGRPDEELQALVNRLIEEADALVAPASDFAVALSAEIQFIDANVRINRNHVATAMAGGT